MAMQQRHRGGTKIGFFFVHVQMKLIVGSVRRMSKMKRLKRIVNDEWLTLE